MKKIFSGFDSAFQTGLSKIVIAALVIILMSYMHEMAINLNMPTLMESDEIARISTVEKFDYALSVISLNLNFYLNWKYWAIFLPTMLAGVTLLILIFSRVHHVFDRESVLTLSKYLILIWLGLKIIAKWKGLLAYPYLTVFILLFLSATMHDKLGGIVRDRVETLNDYQESASGYNFFIYLMAIIVIVISYLIIFYRVFGSGGEDLIGVWGDPMVWPIFMELFRPICEIIIVLALCYKIANPHYLAYELAKFLDKDIDKNLDSEIK